MNSTRNPVLHRVVQAAQLAGAALGAVASYGFGVQIGGMPMGALMAANGAFFGAIMVGFVADLIWREGLNPASEPGGRDGSSG